MPQALRHLQALNTSSKLLLLKIYFLLGYYRAAILLTSFKRLSSPLQHYREEPQRMPASDQQKQRAAHLGYLVAGAARFTPWQSRCLVQVLTLQRLMAKEGIGGRFYLGVNRKSESGELSAHAWLRCGEQIVNGAYGHEQFAVVSTFSWLER
ncbi:lasso peptide biosynthesis B2 protein [Pseudohalioglobus lutimaris]|nr:lasso peptide biosynthesis B2 protein [Pseudohalioglobus lutimaris]